MQNAPASASVDPRVAVIGGGLSGLAVGRELVRAGVDCAVFESADEAGGVIRSERRAGLVLDYGPQRIRLTAALASLVHELGIDDALLPATPGLPLLVYHDGRLRRVPFTVGALLRTDLLDARAKLRLLAEPFAALTPGRGDDSAADFLIRRFGRQAYERVLGPLFGGLYAGDPAVMPYRTSLGPALRQLGLRHSFVLTWLTRWRRAALPPAYSFHDGMQTLATALRATLGARVRTGERVLALHDAGDGVAIETSAATHRAEHVVMCVPAGTAAELLRDLDASAADALASLRYNEFTVVHLRAPEDVPAAGWQVAFGEPLATRGVTCNGALFGRAGLHTAFVGGAHAAAGAAHAERTGEVARREFCTVTGLDAEVLDVARARMPAWDQSWRALDRLRLPARVTLCANYESRPGIPGRLARAAQVAARLAR
jgi:protoporphyrinogen/coproporphyrinogen III oxidase